MTEEVMEQDELLLTDEEIDRSIIPLGNRLHWTISKPVAEALLKAQLVKAKQHYEQKIAFALEDGFDKGVGHERKYGQKGLDRPELREKIRHLIVAWTSLNKDEEIVDMTGILNQILALIPDIDLLWKLDADRNWSMCEWLKTLPKYFEVIKEEAKKQERERIKKSINDYYAKPEVEVGIIGFTQAVRQALGEK